MGEKANEYHIQSVAFGEDWTEIVFVEDRHRSKDVVTIQTQLIGTNLFVDQLQSIKEDIVDLIDQSFVHRRLRPREEDVNEA